MLPLVKLMMRPIQKRTIQLPNFKTFRNRLAFGFQEKKFHLMAKMGSSLGGLVGL